MCKYGQIPCEILCENLKHKLVSSPENITNFFENIINSIIFVLSEHDSKYEDMPYTGRWIEVEIGYSKWPPGTCLACKRCTFAFAVDSVNINGLVLGPIEQHKLFKFWFKFCNTQITY